MTKFLYLLLITFVFSSCHVFEFITKEDEEEREKMREEIRYRDSIYLAEEKRKDSLFRAQVYNDPVVGTWKKYRGELDLEYGEMEVSVEPEAGNDRREHVITFIAILTKVPDDMKTWGFEVGGRKWFIRKYRDGTYEWEDLHLHIINRSSEYRKFADEVVYNWLDVDVTFINSNQIYMNRDILDIQVREYYENTSWIVERQQNWVKISNK